jgi:hypothetical protein
MASEFLTLPKKTATAKLSAIKGAIYYYRPRGGIAVEREADVEQVVRAMAGHPKMKMRVRLSDSQHFIVLVDTKKLQYGYQISF